jgi:hypothetical protein
VEALGGLLSPGSVSSPVSLRRIGLSEVWWRGTAAFSDSGSCFDVCLPRRRGSGARATREVNKITIWLDLAGEQTGADTFFTFLACREEQDRNPRSPSTP